MTITGIAETRDAFGSEKSVVGDKQAATVFQHALMSDAGPSQTVRGIEAGAAFGGLAGGSAGFLVGIGIVAIPDIGPTLAGWLASTAAGVAAGVIVGAVAGGLFAPLTRQGASNRGRTSILHEINQHR